MKITFTGLDNKTTRAQVEALLKDPRVELGVLLSANPDSRNRYMYPHQVQTMLEWCAGRSALHVCGGARRQLFNGQIDHMVNLAGRVQVNGMLEVSDVENLCRRFPTKEFITQHTTINRNMLEVSTENHVLLVDGSGGRGISPKSWQRPDTAKRVGFAGGLGPSNIVQEVELIKRVAREPFWIDMEGQLRDYQDWFDVAKCLDVLSALPI